MTRFGLYLAWIAFVVAVVTAVSTYATGYTMPEDPTLWHRFIEWYQPHARVGGLTAAGLLAAANFLLAAFARPSFRQDTIRSLLDVLSGQCLGQKRRNRITLFKRTKGCVVFMICLWRLRWMPWRKSKRAKFKSLLRIDPTGDYLYAYVRSTDAKGPRSTAFFQISDTGGMVSEGYAGHVWEWEFAFIPSLPKLTDAEQAKLKELTLEEILALNPSTKLNQYVRGARIPDTERMRAMGSYPRHFMGHMIYVVGSKSRRWGVLLLDSEEDSCPFSPVDANNAGPMGDMFKAQAESIGHVLRKG